MFSVAPVVVVAAIGELCSSKAGDNGFTRATITVAEILFVNILGVSTKTVQGL
jgi:hypothetical protein